MEDQMSFNDSIETDLESPTPPRKKVMIGINTLTSIDQSVYSNHMQFYFRLGRNFPNFDFILNNPKRMSIDAMRNQTAKIALDNNCDYVMFIDDDVCVPIDTFGRLLQADADIAAGWTIIRGYPYENMMFKYKSADALTLYKTEDFKDIDENGLLPCDAVGFSCVLIKSSLLRKIQPPFFVTGPYNTEDVYFCLKAKEAVPDVKIIVDTQVKTAHNLGSEYIDPLNRDLYKKYVEEITPALLAPREPEKQELRKVDTPEENPLSYEQVLVDAIFNK